MKRIDYFFLIYSVVLLLFGFDDTPHPERQSATRSKIGLESRAVALKGLWGNQLIAREDSLLSHLVSGQGGDFIRSREMIVMK